MDSIRLRECDNEYVWHPFSPMQAYREEDAPIIVSGDGFFLIDSDGNRYLDGISSLWCNVHGHRIPEIDQAVRQQLDRIAHSTLLGLSNPVAIELASELVQRTPPDLNKVFYSDNGATAVEVALKMAYQYHIQKHSSPGKRDIFVCLSGAYHGDTIGSVSVGGIDLFHATYSNLLFDTVCVPSPVTYRTPDGYDADSYLARCYDELARVIVENQDRIAALVIEPLVQGAAGILVHPSGYLKRVRQLTADHKILLIADEVAVGFGRTGSLFACEQEDVCPDLLCLAKGISGGYLPLAATLATDEIYDAFLDDPTKGKTFYHGHTYTGNPLGCAAALASLNLLEQNRVLDNVRMNAQRLADSLARIEDWPHVGEIRQKGIMVGIELVLDREKKTPYALQERMGHQVTLAARNHGVIIRPLGDVIVLMPAPAMPGELLDQLCDTVIDAIDETTN